MSSAGCDTASAAKGRVPGDGCGSADAAAGGAAGTAAGALPAPEDGRSLETEEERSTGLLVCTATTVVFTALGGLPRGVVEPRLASLPLFGVSASNGTGGGVPAAANQNLNQQSPQCTGLSYYPGRGLDSAIQWRRYAQASPGGAAARAF